VTLNSDDPAMFGTTLQEEFLQAAAALSSAALQWRVMPERSARFVPGRKEKQRLSNG